MCAAHRRSGGTSPRDDAGAGERRAPFADRDAVAPPAALPRGAGWRDRWRVVVARRRGVVVGRDVVVGRRVVFDLGAGARLTLGDGVALGDGCRFHLGPGAEVTVGASTRLGERCAITAQAGVTLGARCLLGDEVVLIDATPRHGDAERPIRAQGLAATPIAVGDDVRIGPSAALLRGATVPAHATIPAHATLSADPGHSVPRIEVQSDPDRC